MKKRITNNKPRRVKNLVIVECDAPRLRREKQFITQEIEVLASNFVNCKITKLETGDVDEKEILARFAEAVKGMDKADVLVVFGHCIEDSGMCFLSDKKSERWSSVAKWLTPFRPKNVILIGCWAGKSAVIKELFSVMPDPQKIYASPQIIDGFAAQVLVPLIIQLLRGKRVDPESKIIGQAATFLATGKVFYEWSREDVKDPSFSNYDLLAVGLENLHRNFFRRSGS